MDKTTTVNLCFQMLAHAGVGMRYGTDDAVLVELLLRRSYPHLREMFTEFQVLKRHPIEDSIRLDFRGGLRDGLLALGKLSLCKCNYL